MDPKLFTYQLYSGYNLITLSQTIDNVKKITVKKFAYRFIQPNQLLARLSIVGHDIWTYTDGITTANYTMTFFNAGGLQNGVINYINKNDAPDVKFEYGTPLTQFYLVFDIDNSSGGSPDVSQTNPILIELEFSQ